MAIDQLTRVYTEQRRFAEAAALLRSAVERLPYERIKYTRNLAVVAYQSGDKAAAARTLESIRDDLRKTDAGSVTALYMLGEVYLELGRRNDALDAFRQFLDVSKAFESPELEGMRDSARRRIGR